MKGLEHITKGLEILKPTTEVEIQNLRRNGLREAALGQVTFGNQKRLVWIEYSNGERRLNIWNRS